MKSKVLIAIIALAASMSPAIVVSAQDYVAPPVTISTDKVRVEGKVYYSHVVEERQTLYSISKAYGVGIDEIYEANPKLKETGLQKNSIILIPAPDIQASHSRKDKEKKAASNESRMSASSQQKRQDNTEPAVEEPARQDKPKGKAASANDQGETVVYVTHTVKWYEDIESIAEKYDTTPEAIMQANGLRDRKLQSRQKLRIPKSQQGGKDKETKKDNNTSSTPSYSPKSKVNAVLMLPFNADKEKPSRQCLDFYSGALVAVRDLGLGGLNVDLSVYDTGNGTIPVTYERLNSSNIVIGPIERGQITSVLSKTSGNTFVVSPLDHATEVLAGTYSNFVQAPSSSMSQYQNLVSWIREDKKHGDRVMLISEKSVNNTMETDTLRAMLIKEGIYYSTFRYNILEGRDILDSLSVKLTSDGENRILIASENEAFVNDVLRNLNLLVHNKYSITLYGPSKIRSFDTVDVEDLHNVKFHVATSYHIDYDNKKVRDFIMKYRALYNTEPTRFAFQGYDTMNYFCSMYAKCGDVWPVIAEKSAVTPMLQSDYKLARHGKGFVNVAVRRVVYGPRWSIRKI